MLRVVLPTQLSPTIADLSRVTATSSTKVRRRRPLRRRSTQEIGSSAGRLPGADSALLAEARILVGRRRWKRSLDLLEIYRSLHPDDGEADQLMALAAAHAGKRKQRDAALARLTSGTPDANDWEAVAASHLATRRYLDADTSARQALEIAPHSPAAWGALATSYAGLGWFDDAADCLDRCDENGGLSPLARWQLGRSINRWAMGRNHAPLVAMLATMLLGNVFLGLAVAFTTPLAFRELRAKRLEPRFRTNAEETWATQRGLRIAYASVVLTLISVWALLLVLFQPA